MIIMLDFDLRLTDCYLIVFGNYYGIKSCDLYQVCLVLLYGFVKLVGYGILLLRLYVGEIGKINGC
jgi:hypothetical protein